MQMGMYNTFSYGSEGYFCSSIAKSMAQYSTFSHGSEGKLDTNDLSSLLYISVLSHGGVRSCIASNESWSVLIR